MPEKRNIGKHMVRGKRALAVLALAALLGTGVPEAGHAADWNALSQANRYEAEGNYSAAAPLWEKLFQQFAEEDSANNAALMAKNLGHYYDGIGDYENAIRYYELEDKYWLQAGENWGAEDMQRAEQIRLTLDLYVSAGEQESLSRSAGPNGGLAKFEPAYGAYLGLYPEQDPLMGNRYIKSEQLYKKKHAIYLAYTQWGKSFPNGYAKNAKEAGAALQIAFEPSQGLDQVQDNAYIRQWAREAKASGIPIFLRYASEMNGAWTVWNGDPETYIAKWRLLHRIMQEEAPNVAMVWSPGDVPRGTMSAYYPGDDYVDWVGVSLYTEPYEHGNIQASSLGISPVERLDELYTLYADRKPIMISETAVAHSNHNDSGTVWTEWGVMNLDRLYSVMTKKYPRLKAITYFNVDQGQRNSYNDYLLSHNDGMMSAYRSLIADPYFLTKVETGAKPAAPSGFRKAEGTVAFAKHLSVVPYIKIPDVMIGRVAYLLNGALLSEQASAPFRLELDAGAVPPGSVLELAVYKKNGDLAVRKALTLEPIVSVRINGKDYAFDQPPVVINGSTLAPVRAIFNALGATVDWDARTETATGRKGGQTVSITIGSRTVMKGGAAVQLPVPAQLINGSTMVPARFVGEAFGGKVTWDGKSATVNIETP
ncbi:stalk domain-containing protein [Gorillibacterium sp. sgz5001074]|uniref:stalk domain-containing protein n=1 Tax=Gorillibacterium sp. sgz5001074 TaxID=3446695 RepID=UPI003F676A5C